MNDEGAAGVDFPLAVYRPFGLYGISSENERAFLDPLPQPHVGPVFHYTTAEGVHGILNSGSIFDSHAVTLNDPQEGSYGWRVIRERFAASPPAGGHRFSREFEQMFSADGDRSWETPAFVLSGTHLAGDLNQYRLYGMYQLELKAGTWSAIALRPDTLLPPPRARWRPVLYGNKSAEPYIDRMLAWAVRIMNSVSQEDFEDTGLIAALAIQVLALHIKDDSYAHEKELRLVFGVETWSWQDWVQVRARSGRLVPYVVATTEDDRTGGVRAVELGPTVQGQANADAVRHLHSMRFPHSSLGGHGGLPVTESPTRFRDG